jgi:uncharacterized protein with HEPN domain
MSRRDDATSLRQMLEHARELATLMRGKTLHDLERDRVLELAAMRLLQIVGEAAGRVSDKGQAAHPEIPWARIRGMRNIVVHVYDDVDLVQVWRTIERDLPELVAALERIVR